MSIAFRYVHECKIIERFTGYTHAIGFDARALADYILCCTSTFDLDLSNCVSQCYDGATVMSGCNAGVQALIREKCNQAVYVHCCAHRLNLVLVDEIPLASNFLPLLKHSVIFMKHLLQFRNLEEEEKLDCANCLIHDGHVDMSQ